MRTIAKTLFFIVLMGMLYSLPVAAEEEKLQVDITSYEGEKIAALPDVPILTSTPVIFSPAQVSGENYYCISIDDGESFGAYTAMGENVTVFPDGEVNPEGKWMIRFMNITEEEQTVSDVYTVMFDLTPPLLRFEDDDCISGWITDNTRLHFSASDSGGIGRVIATCDGSVLYEHHSKSADEYEHSFSFVAGRTKKAVNTVQINCHDLAGNCSVFSFEYRFDTSAPEIFAEGIVDGEIYKSGVSIKAKAYDDDDGVYICCESVCHCGTETVSATQASEGTYDEFYFEKEGRYHISLYAVDSAGNRSHAIERSFIIDGTAPVISVEGISDGVDQRTAANVSINISEMLFDTAEVNISLTRSTMDNTEYIPIQSYIPQAVNDLREVNINSDGEYELQVLAKDGAGNAAKSVRRFRIDTTAPDISVEGIDEGEAVRDPVIRFNAGEMFYSSTVMSSVLEKKQKDGYRQVSRDDRVMQGARDHMDIHPEKEGEYRLTCTATDRSGNSASKTVDFVVDATPPVISGINEMDNRFLKSFTLPGKVADLVTDATKVSANVYVNDTPVGDNEVIIEEGKYVLTILAEDSAGNASEASASFIVDHTSPQVVLEGFDRDGNIKKGSMIKVGLADESDQLLEVKFDGRNIVIDKDNKAYIAVDGYGEHVIAVRATDSAGNVTDTEIHPGCYMYAGPLGDYIRTEKTITASRDESGEGDLDMKGLIVGLASVLSGTFGLTYRGAARS